MCLTCSLDQKILGSGGRWEEETRQADLQCRTDKISWQQNQRIIQDENKLVIPWSLSHVQAGGRSLDREVDNEIIISTADQWAYKSKTEDNFWKTMSIQT